MARDMDFSGSRSNKKPIVAANTLAQPVVSTPRITKPVQAKKTALSIWLVIVVIIAVGILAFWHYFQPTSISQKTTSTNALSAAVPTLDPTSSNSLLATKKSLPTVQVYDSGAGSDAVLKAMSSLKDIGYLATNENKSQFNYDKTYIWYITGLEADAVKIQSALAPRVAELKESKSAGSFEIMILLGTK